MGERRKLRKRELRETLDTLWDEVLEDALEFSSALARLRKLKPGSEAYDEQWGRIAAALFALKLKADDAYKLMEKIEELELQGQGEAHT